MPVTTTSPILVEACVDSVESAMAAELGGARRIELCDNLVDGGTTPSAATIAICRERLRLPIHVLVRPRGGDFLYSDVEVEVVRRDIGWVRELGADGVVIGALRADGAVDTGQVGALIAAARPILRRRSRRW
jgi:copper homeostasis protein